ncbi:MAG: lytic transglycosylase domain-containing protein [Rhodanobacteraceae bacterium]
MFRPGARGGWRALPPSRTVRLMRMAPACVLLLAFGWTGLAAASVLYRCAGAHGVTAFVSHTAGYRNCEKVGAWNASAPRMIKASARVSTPPSSRPPSATVLPGKPPQTVKANPAVLKVMPLGEENSIEVKKLTRSQVWQPLPVEILQSLGGRVLPRLLGVQAPPAPTPPAGTGSSPAPAPAATNAARPLMLQADSPAPPRRGAVYRVVQKNGTVLYTNIASLAKGRDATTLFTYIVECYACNVHSKIDWNTVPLHLVAYGKDIRSAAKLTGVDAALLRAVIHAESGFNSRALSYKGAQGLMQLMPGTAFELGVGDAFDPGQNISGGARYLAMLLRDFHGSLKLAAAAYNAGEGAVTKYGGVPPYAETQVYVKRVALLYQRYRKALAGSGSELAAADRPG